MNNHHKKLFKTKICSHRGLSRLVTAITSYAESIYDINQTAY